MEEKVLEQAVGKVPSEAVVVAEQGKKKKRTQRKGCLLRTRSPGVESVVAAAAERVVERRASVVASCAPRTLAVGRIGLASLVAVVGRTSIVVLVAVSPNDDRQERCNLKRAENDFLPDAATPSIAVDACTPPFVLVAGLRTG